jgi:predicted PurR-regulated permease PerM
MATAPGSYLNWLKAFVILGSFGLTLGLLYWLQSVLIPVALAILLTFLLSPLVTLLERRRFPRALAVVLVVMVAFSAIGGIGWMVARQVTSLVDTFPQYEHNLSKKIAALQAGESGFIDKLARIVQRITRQIEKNPPPIDSAKQEEVETHPLPVKVIQEGGPFQLSRLWSVLGPVLGPFAAIGLAVVLLIFMLIRREDLRDRVISLVGHGRLTLTTKALDEAGERVSQYLLMQLIINGSYGAAVAAGLYFIGIPYALLWGFFAAVFRYIPYLGPWLAALLPIGLSLLVSESWTAPLLVVGLFLTLELFSNMVIEPRLYGHRIGVSETAILIMLAFWTWLWGPIGLILATPLTVCLVLLGKYVPFLKFFDTLLGDQPALEADIGYYQRLLARDVDEASDIAEEHLASHTLEETYDGLLIPALIYSKCDLESDDLDEEDQRFVVESTREIVEELSTLRDAAATTEASKSAASEDAPASQLIPILGCSARDDADEVALLMLKELVDPKRCDVTLTTAALLASEVVARVEETNPALLCIAALPPGGQAHTRLLCLRLHSRFPDLKIIIGRWGLKEDLDKKREQLLSAGADHVGTTLHETRNQIETLLQLVAPGEAEKARHLLSV